MSLGCVLNQVHCVGLRDTALRQTAWWTAAEPHATAWLQFGSAGPTVSPKSHIANRDVLVCAWGLFGMGPLLLPEQARQRR